MAQHLTERRQRLLSHIDKELITETPIGYETHYFKCLWHHAFCGALDGLRLPRPNECKVLTHDQESSHTAYFRRPSYCDTFLSLFIRVWSRPTYLAPRFSELLRNGI